MTALLVILLLLVLASSVVLLWPYRHETEKPRIQYDLSVYHDQIFEVGSDITAGLLQRPEVEVTGREIFGRMLEAEKQNATDFKDTATRTSGRKILICSVALVSCSAFLLYALLGSPFLPSQPFASRATNDPSYPLLLQLEKELKALPSDDSSTQFKKIGSLDLKLGRNEEAKEAFKAAVAHDPKDSEAWSLLAESLLLGQNGTLTIEIVDAFRRAYMLDNSNRQAEFFLGLAEEEAGSPQKAISIWKDLLTKIVPPNSLIGMTYSAIQSTGSKTGVDALKVNPEAPSHFDHELLLAPK